MLNVWELPHVQKHATEMWICIMQIPTSLLPRLATPCWRVLLRPTNSQVWRKKRNCFTMPLTTRHDNVYPMGMEIFILNQYRPIVTSLRPNSISWDFHLQKLRHQGVMATPWQRARNTPITPNGCPNEASLIPTAIRPTKHAGRMMPTETWPARSRHRITLPNC